MSDSLPAAFEPSVRDRIVAILVRETGVDADRLTSGTPIRDLGIESIDMVQAIFAIETEFDIEIPPGIEKEDATLGDLLATIETQVAAKSAASAAPVPPAAGTV